MTTEPTRTPSEEGKTDFYPRKGGGTPPQPPIQHEPPEDGLELEPDTVQEQIVPGTAPVPQPQRDGDTADRIRRYAAAIGLQDASDLLQRVAEQTLKTPDADGLAEWLVLTIRATDPTNKKRTQAAILMATLCLRLHRLGMLQEVDFLGLGDGTTGIDDD